MAVPSKVCSIDISSNVIEGNSFGRSVTRGNGYSVPPRIPNGYPRQRPQVADQTSPQKPFIDFRRLGALLPTAENE